MAILFKDGFDYIMPTVSKTISKTMDIVKDAFNFAYPGITFAWHTNFSSPSIKITLSKWAGNQICYSAENVSEVLMAKMESNGKDAGLWILKEIIPNMVKHLEAQVKETLAKQWSSGQAVELDYKTPEWSSSTPPSKITFNPKFYTVSMSDLTSYGSTPAEPKVESKIESLDQMYDSAPKFKPIKKVKVKLTAAEKVNLKKQLALGIPADLTLAKAKKLHDLLSAKWGKDWMDILTPTKEIKEEVKKFVEEVSPKLNLNALTEIMDMQLAGIADSFFKESAFFSYLKEPVKTVKFDDVKSGIQAVKVGQQIYENQPNGKPWTVEAANNAELGPDGKVKVPMVKEGEGKLKDNNPFWLMWDEAKKGKNS